MRVAEQAWLVPFNANGQTFPQGETLSVTTHRGWFILEGGSRYAMQWRLGTAAGVASDINIYRTAAPYNLMQPDDRRPDLDPSTNTWWVEEPASGLAFTSLPNGAAEASHPIQFSGTAWTYVMIEIVVTTQIDAFFFAVSKK